MEVVNKKLYENVKEDAKKKFKSYPSAYASAWIIREYKKRGGKYRSKKKSTSELLRWFEEDWRDICTGKKCGREDSTRKYPVCRPSKRVSASTGLLAKDIPKKEKQRLCRTKRKDPKKKITF